MIGWQLQRLLFEEPWIIVSNKPADEVRRALEKFVSMPPSNKISVRLDVNVTLDGDNIVVRGPWTRVLGLALGNTYYFSGEIVEKFDKAEITGIYRANKWRRITSLYILNFCFLYVLVLLGTYFYIVPKYWNKIFDPKYFNASLELLLLPILSFGVFAIFYAFFWFITQLEKTGRSDIFRFLSFVTK